MQFTFIHPFLFIHLIRPILSFSKHAPTFIYPFLSKHLIQSIILDLHSSIRFCLYILSNLLFYIYIHPSVSVYTSHPIYPFLLKAYIDTYSLAFINPSHAIFPLVPKARALGLTSLQAGAPEASSARVTTVTADSRTTTTSPGRSSSGFSTYRIPMIGVTPKPAPLESERMLKRALEGGGGCLRSGGAHAGLIS